MALCAAWGVAWGPSLGSWYGGGMDAEDTLCGQLVLLFPLPHPSGDPAGPAQAAQHGSAVPAADVCRPAAAPHAADGGLAAAAPQQRTTPEPGSSAAGERWPNPGAQALSESAL